jgi:hypothetical protein
MLNCANPSLKSDEIADDRLAYLAGEGVGIVGFTTRSLAAIHTVLPGFGDFFDIKNDRV